MRLFVAIALPSETLQMLQALGRELQQIDAEVRWVRPESMHLTLEFIGEVDEGRVAELAGALERSASTHSSFELRAAGLGAFPERGAPRVVWFGIADPEGRLERLQADVARACASVGLHPEERAFHPHLTLGRVQGKRNLRPLADRIRIGSASASSFPVSRINLYQSTLRRSGAIYGVVREFPLAPAAGRPSRR
jgi:2'-5' RNA ligase